MSVPTTNKVPRGQAKVYFLRMPSTNPKYKWVYLGARTTTNNTGGIYPYWLYGNKKPAHKDVWLGTRDAASRMARRLGLDYDKVEVFHYRLDRRTTSPARLELSRKYSQQVRSISGPASMLARALEQAGLTVHSIAVTDYINETLQILREDYLTRVDALPNKGLTEAKNE